eukprot:SAG31_NODE_111_length_24443_cov_231.743685_12_plen_101_part_00
MEAPGFDPGSSYESDFFVSNMSVRLSFGYGSAYESDLSSSTVHCSGSNLGSSHGSDIPFLAEIAVDTEYGHGFPPISIRSMLPVRGAAAPRGYGAARRRT